MLFSRLIFSRIKLHSSLRFTSTDINLVDEINRIKTKELTKILTQQQTQKFLQARRSLGGKFHSLDQFRNEFQNMIDFDKFISFLLALKTKAEQQKQRINIEPRLTSTNIAGIESVCSLDYTSSFINWCIVKTLNDKNQFQVIQWSSLEMEFDRKYNFMKTYKHLYDGLSSLPLNDANVLLVEQTTYRYANVKIATYLSQLQQTRAILNTLLHSQLVTQRPVYHISGRDIGLHFGLFVGNEQSSAEFFLTNLIFNNLENKPMLELDIDHKLKFNYQHVKKGQKEPMAQCLLRAIAFLQCVNQKKQDSSQ